MNIKKLSKNGRKLRTFNKKFHAESDIIYILESDKNSDIIHKKTGNIYHIIGKIINATNNRDGEEMILYTDGKNVYSREINEFYEKFEKQE